MLGCSSSICLSWAEETPAALLPLLQAGTAQSWIQYHFKTTALAAFVVWFPAAASRKKFPKSLWGQAGWGLEQCGIVEDVPSHGMGWDWMGFKVSSTVNIPRLNLWLWSSLSIPRAPLSCPTGEGCSLPLPQDRLGCLEKQHRTHTPLWNKHRGFEDKELDLEFCSQSSEEPLQI